MVDFALDFERKQGLPPQQAIHQAALLRFRPIMMTTMAALFGALPLTFGTGAGAELRQPLGITIVGGLMLSQTCAYRRNMHCCAKRSDSEVGRRC